MSDRVRAKAPKAVRTSDVGRPRTLLISVVGAIVGVSIAVAAEGTPLSAERPIARPHAKVACASCHTDLAPASSASATTIPSAAPSSLPPPPSPGVVAAAACKNCHGTSHPSTRAAHRNLAAKGELTCATCHTQHAGAQGVTFNADGTIVRWGASSEVILPPPRQSGVAEGAIAAKTTVPLVSLAVCAKCHDESKASDPISACIPANARAAAYESDAGAAVALKKRVSLCFDEHHKLNEALKINSSSSNGPAPVCAAQHGSTRFVAWDAAREIAATTPWVGPSKKEGVPWVPGVSALFGGLVLGGAATAFDRRRRRKAADPSGGGGAKGGAKGLLVAPAARKRLPTINTSTCLGCYACVDACPFDVLTIEKYVAVVARPDECCGVVLCEQVCPNGSLRVDEGEPILDRPATDDDLESKDVPGLFLAGDLTGLPLIKNAINQGSRVIDKIAATLPRRRVEQLDVLVIGAGPAGLAAALRAKEKDLNCLVVEQATIAASIKSFPRDKIVHDPPLDLPIEGELWLKQATKEEILAQWTRIVRARALDVREGHRVVDLVRDRASPHGAFVVTMLRAHDGQQIQLRASRVVLAIGRRGTPRRLEQLEIERGAEDRISYALADARSFEGKRVVVVGLGDSAMEAALALARQPGTTVTISYRGPRFSRGKAKNVGEIETLIAQKKLRILFETVPVAISKTSVTLEGTGPHRGRRSIGAEAMIVLIGGMPAWDLLTRAGIVRPERKESGTKHVV
jgi:thioredoxin reductase/NAD-dependent dihydropyrimidine dehydrogenase PreA subunit